MPDNKKNIFSQRITQMEESATIAMSQKARELKQAGKDVISLSLGEPDFDTPDHIKAAAKQAIDQGYTKYTPVPGYLELREAICQKFKRDNQLNYQPSQIVVSTGAKQSIANAVLCLVEKGDEVLLPTPYWVSYSAQIELAGGTIVEVNTNIENHFKLSPSQLEAAITPRTKLIIFSSPSNPTGTVYSQAELCALSEVILQHENLYVIADEIYELINFGSQHASLARCPGMMERTITVNGLSKGFAMTGWRLGYLAAPQAIASACSKMQGQFTSGTCSITQRAAIAALTGTLAPSKAMCQQFKNRRDLVLKLVQEIPHIGTYLPTGAFYLFPNVSHYLGSTTPQGETLHTVNDLCMYLLNNAHVSLVTGSAFGNDQCLRISYAASEAELKEAMARLKKAFAALRLKTA